MSGPLTVEVTRGLHVESRHQVHVAIADAAGLVDGWGDTDRLTYARSSLKPIQAMPLVTTGAAATYGLSADELALACASHNGEHEHVELVDQWLSCIGASVRDLECGARPPMHAESADDLVRQGRLPDPRHSDCSGKHAGFLTVAAHQGLPIEGYVHPDHPVQSAYVTPAIEDVCRVDLSAQTPGIDGCGIPVWGLRLVDIAVGWSQLTSRGAGRQLLEAMVARPHLVAGTDRSCTRLMRDADGLAAVKGGAEGVYCGADLETGLAFALKVEDGTRRAAEVAAEWLLDRWGRVEHAASHPLTNWAGTPVGEVRVAQN